MSNFLLFNLFDGTTPVANDGDVISLAVGSGALVIIYVNIDQPNATTSQVTFLADTIATAQPVTYRTGIGPSTHQAIVALEIQQGVAPGVYRGGMNVNNGQPVNLGFIFTVAGNGAAVPASQGAPIIKTDYPGITSGAWEFPAGSPINFQLSALPIATSWRSPKLPPGLSIANDGTVSGFVDQSGAYQMVVIATNSQGDSAPANFSVTITAPSGVALAAPALSWIPPQMIDIQVDLRRRAAFSSLLGAVAGFTAGEDLQLAVIPRLGGNYIFSSITAIALIIRPADQWDCEPLILDNPSPNLVAVQFSITVTSSSSSPTVTATSIPSNFVIGATLLGSTVINISGLTITLAGNANATNGSPTAVNFTTPTQQYYLLEFNLSSDAIARWFGVAATGADMKITANAVLKFVYLSKTYITEPFPFPILQSIANPLLY